MSGGVLFLYVDAKSVERNDSRVKTLFMVRLGSPRTEQRSENSVGHPFAVSIACPEHSRWVEGLLTVFTQPDEVYEGRQQPG